MINISTYKNNLSLIIAGILFLLFSGCKEPIDFKLVDGNNNRLTVEGGITTEKKSHVVKLTRTAPYYLNKAADKVSGAKVYIICEKDTIRLTEKDKGYYLTNTNVSGVIGKTYTLKVDINAEHYEATSKINRIGSIDSISTSFFNLPYYNDGGDGKPAGIGYYKIFFFGQEPPSDAFNKGDYYQWDLYIDGKLQTDSLTKRVFQSDDMVDGSYIHDWDLYRIPAWKVDKDSVLIDIKMYSIGKEYYEFLLATMLETTWKGGPFDGPPANIPSNLNNSGCGFFTAMAAISKSRWVKKSKMAYY
jgi:hypothetical protein